MNLRGWDGLSWWNEEHATETAKIGVGIRPYGLHAGNLAAVVAYPYLVCEDFRRQRGTEPQFRLQVWVNDIEPVAYVGADGRRESADAANMYPESTTFQFTPGPAGFNGSLADYWAPVIEQVVRHTISPTFPQVQLEFRRASELIATPSFQKIIDAHAEKPHELRAVIEQETEQRVRGKSAFIWPIDGMGQIEPERTFSPLTTPFRRAFSRIRRANQTNGFLGYRQKRSSWAAQFRMLHAARLAEEQPDLWVVGMDHYLTNRSWLMEEIADVCGIDQFKHRFLHVPLLFADGGKKLSKSLGASVYMKPHDLIDALRDNTNLGLNVRHAPVSSDILVVGEEALPPYMLNDLPIRRIALDAERSNYETHEKGKRLLQDNAPGKVRNDLVASLLGVPHL